MNRLKKMYTTQKAKSMVLGHLDIPSSGQSIRGVWQAVGWTMYRLDDRWTREGLSIEMELDGNEIPLLAFTWVERPDLLKYYPELAGNPGLRPGFAAAFDISKTSSGLHRLTCHVAKNGQRQILGAASVNVHNTPAAAAFYEQVYFHDDTNARSRKLDLVIDLLKCPTCGHERLDRVDASHLHCPGCERRYPISDLRPVMVAVGEQPRYPLDETQFNTPISNGPYPDKVIDAMSEVNATGGVALDVGSGRRAFGFERLVQVEITNYPLTDVVNQNETLPFKSDSFDFVCSLAVTEHVTRPWDLVREIERVTRPGGLILVDSAFLQPLHGYPNHYFNMTAEGLRSLFDSTDVISLAPEAYQHPWFSLSWILDRVLVDLPDAQRQQLANMKVIDLQTELQKYCSAVSSKAHGFQLPQKRIEELAVGYTLLGRKR